MAAKTKTKSVKASDNSLPMVLLSLFTLFLAFLLAWCWRVHMDAVTVCKAGNLQLSMGDSSGAAGTIYRNAVVTNQGDNDCTLTGYTGAYLMDASNVQLGSGAIANALYTPAQITLGAHGGKAHTVLGFPQAGNFDQGVCSSNATTLKLFLPGVTTPLATALDQANCPGFSATALKAGSGNH
ncbi:MAG TPA: DUF4232 domain-containing protein [Candidatus Saccharimonadales bacterium]|nr:DUF4232 domain-containing protein [Candidatus Saccharimonadales bacterium]